MQQPHGQWAQNTLKSPTCSLRRPIRHALRQQEVWSPRGGDLRWGHGFCGPPAAMWLLGFNFEGGGLSGSPCGHSAMCAQGLTTLQEVALGLSSQWGGLRPQPLPSPAQGRPRSARWARGSNRAQSVWVPAFHRARSPWWTWEAFEDGQEHGLEWVSLHLIPAKFPWPRGCGFDSWGPDSVLWWLR